MEKPRYEDIEQVVEELVLPFYRIERDMTVPVTEPDAIRRNENDAEHSWSLAFMGCAIAPHIDPNLDLGLIAQLSIVHDVPEIYATDVSVWDSPEKLANKPAREAESRRTIADRFSHLPWISETIEAYERKDTPEARFVYALDKFIALIIRRIDEGQYYIEKQLTLEGFRAGLASSREKAQTHPDIGDYYEELWAIFEAHPEYFYQPEA